VAPKARRAHSISTSTVSQAARAEAIRSVIRLMPKALKDSAINQMFSGGLVL
jgi:hypothetical protein